MRELSCEISGLTHKYKLLIEQAAIEAAILDRLKSIGKRAKIPGFRSGHIPLPVLIKNYGELAKRDTIIEEAKKAVDQLVKEKSLRVAMQPSAEVGETTEEGVIINVVVDVLPEVQLIDFEEQNITKYVVKIDDDKIDNFLNEICSKKKFWDEKPEVSVLEKGDKAVVDLLMKNEKLKKKKSPKLQDVEVVLSDEGGMIESIWTNLIGMKKGEEKDFSVDSDKDSSLYHVTIKNTYSPRECKLDDEFAKSIGLNSKDEIRDWAVGVLQNEFKHDANDLLTKQFLDAMSNLYSFDVPSSMIDLERKEIIRNIEIELAKQGKRIIPACREKAEENCYDLAVRRVRLGLVIAKIASENNISVSQEEIRKEVFSIARLYPGNELEVVKRYYNDKVLLSAVLGPLLEEKVVHFMTEKMKNVTVKEITKEELEELNVTEFNDFDDNLTEDIPSSKENDKDR